MLYRDLIDLLMPRAERLGLVDNSTGRPDAVELELYLYQALLDIVDMFDFEAYTVINSNILQTQSGVSEYPLPNDFGRLIYPRVRGKRGIHLNDGSKDYDLDYVDPNTFSRKTNVANQRPQEFTISKRTLNFFPTPDAQYTIRGIYIELVPRPDVDDNVILPNPAVLIHDTIYLLAMDMNRVTQSILDQRTESINNLLSSQTRNARLLQQRAAS